jgi:SAM-dependent methyltransferase
VGDGFEVPAIPGNRYGSRADDYARHRADFPAEAVDCLVVAGVGVTGQRVVDLGCGTGTLARQLAARGCSVTGVDLDGRMLDAARRLASEASLTVAWKLGRAEKTGLDPGLFEAVVAVQCWHWFDGSAAAGEARRLLAPGGRVAVCGFDWLPLPGAVSEVTENLISVHNTAWDLRRIRDPAPGAEADLALVDIEVAERFTWDLDVAYPPESWRRRIGASSAIVNLDLDRAEAFDRELAGVLDERFGGGKMTVPHRVWGLVSAPVG